FFASWPASGVAPTIRTSNTPRLPATSEGKRARLRPSRRWHSKRPDGKLGRRFSRVGVVIMARTLDQLFQYLDGLRERAPLAELVAQLDELDVDADDVAPFLRFSGRGYTRNLMHGGPWYNVLVLCWKNGQRSPIHDHKGSSCGVRVLRGTATETLFD